MLTVASKFHRYSLNNLFLIWRQNPDATRVAGYRVWQKLGRQVRKGEHGIRILAPARYKTKGEDGSETWQVRGFTVVSVFDISQTDGEDLPDDVTPELLTGEGPEGAWDAVANLITSRGYTIQRGDCDGANGYVRWSDRVVKVRDDVDPAQALKTLIHELAHIDLGHETWAADRPTKEVEAESVAYVIGQAIGLTTTEYTLPYVAGWARGDSDLIRETATRVVKTADAILNALQPA